MNTTDWAFIQHFSPQEFFYHSDSNGAWNMSFESVRRLDEIREIIGKPIHIQIGGAWSPRGTHDASKSEHYNIPCTAIDWYVLGATIQEMYDWAKLRFKDGGIGVYPKDKVRTIPSVHTDLGNRRRWAKVNGVYRDIDGVVAG